MGQQMLYIVIHGVKPTPPDNRPGRFAPLVIARTLIIVLNNDVIAPDASERVPAA